MPSPKCVIVSLLIASQSLTGCHRSPTTIAVIPRTCGTPLWEPLHAGALAQARDEKLHVYWNAPAQEGDVQKQIGYIHLSMDRGYKGVIIAPDETHALRTPVGKLLAENVPVVVINDDLGLKPGPKLSYVVNDEEVGGQIAARRVAQILNSKGSIALIGINANLRSMQKRALSFERTLAAEAPQVKIVARELAGNNLPFEQGVAEQILRSHPDINAIVALSATSTRGAYYAKLGMTEKSDVSIIGFDQDLLPPIRAGEIDSVVIQRTFQIGLAAMKSMAQMLKSEEVPRQISIAPVLLTRETLDSVAFREQSSYTTFQWGQE